MKILLLVLCAFLYSCIDSEAVVYQKESEEIAISAFILGQDSTQIKDTTITLNDSILLIGNIFPERKNHIQKFFWKTPENAIYKEFQIQVKPNFPGDFTYHFFVIDFHGDSLSDSIQIHVSTPPVLDSNSFLPENNSSRLPPDSLIFSWLASDDDKDELFYQFKLFQDENLIIDTSLNETFFKLPFDLQALECYRWELSVFDSKGIQGNTLISTFSTGTKSNKARFRGEISIFPDTLLSQIVLTLESKDSSQVLSLQNGFFDSKEIPPGDYKLSAKLPSYADYKTESISVTLKKGDFLDKLRIHLDDSQPPTFPLLLKDTLPYASTFTFLIENHGFPLNDSSFKILLDQENITPKFSNDTLYVTLPKYNLPICRFLFLTAEDVCKNKTEQEFLICPESAWANKLQDTTIAQSDTLKIHFQESNPYHLPLKEIVWTSPQNDSWKIIQTTEDSSVYLFGALFETGFYTIKAKSIYENGLEILNQFQLEVIE